MCNSFYGAAPIISAAHTDTYMAPAIPQYGCYEIK